MAILYNVKLVFALVFIATVTSCGRSIAPVEQTAGGRLNIDGVAQADVLINCKITIYSVDATTLQRMKELGTTYTGSKGEFQLKVRRPANTTLIEAEVGPGTGVCSYTDEATKVATELDGKFVTYMYFSDDSSLELPITPLHDLAAKVAKKELASRSARGARWSAENVKQALDNGKAVVAGMIGLNAGDMAQRGPALSGALSAYSSLVYKTGLNEVAPSKWQAAMFDDITDRKFDGIGENGAIYFEGSGGVRRQLRSYNGYQFLNEGWKYAGYQPPRNDYGGYKDGERGSGSGTSSNSSSGGSGSSSSSSSSSGGSTSSSSSSSSSGGSGSSSSTSSSSSSSTSSSSTSSASTTASSSNATTILTPTQVAAQVQAAVTAGQISQQMAVAIIANSSSVTAAELQKRIQTAQSASSLPGT